MRELLEKFDRHLKDARTREARHVPNDVDYGYDLGSKEAWEVAYNTLVTFIESTDSNVTEVYRMMDSGKLATPKPPKKYTYDELSEDARGVAYWEAKDYLELEYQNQPEILKDLHAHTVDECKQGYYDVHGNLIELG